MKRFADIQIDKEFSYDGRLYKKITNEIAVAITKDGKIIPYSNCMFDDDIECNIICAIKRITNYFEDDKLEEMLDKSIR